MKNKKNNLMKKYFSKKAQISYLQIFIIILSIFSISYLIYLETKPVSAQASESICCEKTLDGHTCQDTGVGNCDNSNDYKSALTKCENTNFCKRGCCASNVNGICNKVTSRIDCLNMNGSFFSDSSCNIKECKEGCCFLGSEVEWTNEANCRFESNAKNLDIPMDFRFDENTNTYLKCLFTVKKNEEGACVFNSGDERKCVFTTLEDCISRTGSESNFAHNGTYCSNPILNTTCKAHDHKGCIEGKEDLYWFDSCGNREEVAQDCSLANGNYCGKTEGVYECKDVNCIVDGKARRNAESWCEYDGAIGYDESKGIKDRYGRDTVGSRHVKHICYMGTERIEPCADYRNEICVQEDSQVPGGGTFSQASCRVNNWRRCLEISGKKKNIEEMEKECIKNPDCFVKQIDMQGGFNFKVCLPSYPPGLELNEDYKVVNGVEVPSSADAVCDIATQRCTETWICGIFGCICVDSCKCHTSYFTEKMNEFCVSLGDCGAYTNYVGVVTDGSYGLKVTPGEKIAPRLSKGILESFKKNAGPQANQKPAKPGNYEFFETINPNELTDISEIKDENLSQDLTPFEREILDVSGAMGSPLLLKMLSENVTEEEINQISSSRTANFVAFFNSFSTVRSGITSQIIYKEQKAGGMEIIAAAIAGIIAYVITQSIIAATMAAIMGWLFAMAWIVYVDIDFYCDLWEIPTGGSDCNKCNKMEVPCTKYRCESLGTLCQFINPGTRNELCISKPENATLPKISPLLTVISTGYSYYNIKDNGFEIVDSKDNGCIAAYSTVKIGVKIDPFAKCKFGTDPKQSYEEMPDKFGTRGGSILPAHQMDLFFPSPEALRNRYNLTKEEEKKLGEINLFVKCKTADGKVNPEAYHIQACVKKGPDLTPPVIYIPSSNKSYVKFNQTEKDLRFYVNEPSECKWSIKDQDYDSMENQATCLKFYTKDNMPCDTTLTGVHNTTKFYLRCIDKSENKNKMSQSYVYQLSISKSPLIIEETRPQNGEETIEGVQPFSYTLKLKTSGGAENGKAICEYTELNKGWGDMFLETGASIHSSPLDYMMAGTYRFKFSCEDVAGNVAENYSTFNAYIDNYGPKIIRFYNFYGGLKVFTDESSECRYDFKRNFEFDNASAMSGIGLEHDTYWVPVAYNLQCKDEFDNKGNKITLQAY